MKSIDNYDLIFPFLNFEEEGDFYFIQILKRRKDNSLMNKNNKLITSYYIKSNKEFINEYPDMVKIADSFNAKITIRLNKRNSKKLIIPTIQNLLEVIQQDTNKCVKNIYNNICSTHSSEKELKWLVDLDEEHIPLKQDIIDFINNCRPYDNKNKILLEIPSKTGVHLITKPFDLQYFKGRWSSVEIHKDNPTNLYIP